MNLAGLLLLPITLILSFQTSWAQQDKIWAQIQEIETLQDHAQYVESYQQCKETLEAHSKSLASRQNQEAHIKLLLLKGELENQLSEYATCIKTLQKGIKLADRRFKKPHLLQHELHNTLAIAYFELNYTIKAKNIADSLITTFGNLPPSAALGLTYELLGYLHGLDNQYVLSEQYLTKSFELRKSLSNHDTSLDILRSNYSMAALHFERGNLQLSYNQVQEGLKMLKAYPNPHMEGKYYIMFGNLMRQIGDYNTAEQYYQNGQKLFDKCIPKYHPSYLYLQNSLGGLFFDQDQNKEAISHFRKLIHFINDEAPWQDTSMLIQLYGNIAQNQGRIADTLASRLTLDTALMLLKTQEHKDFTFPMLYINLTNVKANNNYYSGNFGEALKNYINQIEEIEKKYNPYSPILISPLNNLGLTYHSTKEYLKALDCFNRGLKITRWEPEAEDPFSGIIKPFSGSYLLWNRAEIYELLAGKYQDESYVERAYEDYHNYLAFLDYMRNGYREEGSKLILASENKIAYERTLINLMNLKTRPNDWKERAFSYFERSRALVLHDAFRSQGQLEFPDMEEILKKEDKLKKKVQGLQNQYEEAQNSLFVPKEESDQLESSLFQAKNEFFNFLDLLKETHPNYYNLKYEIGNLNLSKVKEKCARENKGVLLYFAGSNTLFSMLITADDAWVNFDQLDYPLYQWIDSLNTSIQKKNQRSNYMEYSSKLYDKLIAPWKDRLPKRFSVVADGALQSLPFDALLMEDPKNPLNFKEYPFLINEYCISYDFSSTMDIATQGKKHLSISQDSALVFAPFSDFPVDTLAYLFKQLNKETDDDIRRKELNTLLYGGVEAYGVNKYFPGKIFYGKDATKDQFLDNTEHYSMYHLTSHAMSFNSPGGSYILFASSESTAAYDTLFVNEIYRLTLNAEQVTLSGCQTGLGSELTGEGISSLARAFIYAGSKTVVFTLWEVSDLQTAQIMITMNKKIASPKARDVALRKAKLDYISSLNDSRYAHPRYWAGILVVGDSESVISKQN